MINSSSNHKLEQAFDHGVLPKPVFHQPLWVHHQAAIWLFWVHRRCCLCGLVCPDYKRVKMNFMCEHCQSGMPRQIPAIKIPLNHANAAHQNLNIIKTPDSQQRFLRTYPVSYYQYPVNLLMNYFKDKEDARSLLGLYSLLAGLPKPEHCHAGNTVILPIPTTSDRIRHRGFSPVLMLAKFLAWRWQLPIWQGVARHDGRRHQRGLSRDERLTNIQTDFYLCQQIPTRQIILFDDVVTTGSTMAAVAKLLMNQRKTVRMIGICVAHGSADFGLDRA